MNHYSLLYNTLRVKQNGQYLAATPNPDRPDRFILIFCDRSEALSYLNAHAAGLEDRFTIETVQQTQIQGILERWGFTGIGLVRDPRLPEIEFATCLTSLHPEQ
ncbi:MAG: hypothetical protein EAZ61_11365 [Oscillatoriales cyanobacterium]|nr:MAG: hypothetical protein EAZ61_11365 [Oscillatoriales cyanobacterium]